MEDEGEVCKQSSSSMSARCPCQRRVCMSGSTSGCALSSLPGACLLCDAFMVTDSFHLSRPFTLKRQLPVKKKKKKKLFGQLLFIASRSCC